MALPPVRQPIAPAAGVAARPDAGRMAAQKAFFEAALGKAQPPAAAAVSAAAPQVQAQAASQPPPVQRAAALPDEPPKKILRPGSLLDIRV